MGPRPPRVARHRTEPCLSAAPIAGSFAPQPSAGPAPEAGSRRVGATNLAEPSLAAASGRSLLTRDPPNRESACDSQRPIWGPTIAVNVWAVESDTPPT
jgi:hypothetical protein